MDQAEFAVMDQEIGGIANLPSRPCCDTFKSISSREVLQSPPAMHWILSHKKYQREGELKEFLTESCHLIRRITESCIPIRPSLDLPFRLSTL